MANVDLNKAKQPHILIRIKDNGESEVWASPRGVRSERPEDWWSPNPTKAFQYKTLMAAIKAAEELRDKYFVDVEKLEAVPYNEYADEHKRKEFYSISDILAYNPKLKTIYVLVYTTEEESKETFYQTEDDRQENIRSNTGYTCYELKRM